MMTTTLWENERIMINDNINDEDHILVLEESVTPWGWRAQGVIADLERHGQGAALGRLIGEGCWNQIG